jgi:hypothetical protein|nr:MAG TPA: hypothetical protein [Crassvirales sp.]
MIFKIQSLIDVITNSSTSIYQIASKSSIDYIKTVINGILIAVGSDKKADDLFDFDIRYDEDVYFAYKDFLYDSGYISDELYVSDVIDPNELHNESTTKYTIEDFIDDDYSSYVNSHVVVTTKDNNKEADKLLGIIEEIYDHYAIFDG